MNEMSDLRERAIEFLMTLSFAPRKKVLEQNPGQVDALEIMLKTLIEPMLEERESLKLQVESTMEHHVAETKDLYKRIADLESFARSCVEALEEIREAYDGESDIDNNGGPNKAMMVVMEADKVLNTDLAKKLREGK